MAEIKDPRAKHLLGEAVRLLVQSGGSGVAVADFIHGFTETLHATFAAPVAGPADIKAQVKEALKEALQELAPPKRQTRVRMGSRKQVAVYLNGTRTSLSLREDLLETAAAVVGDGKSMRKLLKELVSTKPETHPNRSAWVEEQLHQRLLLLKAESTLSQKAAH